MQQPTFTGFNQLSGFYNGLTDDYSSPQTPYQLPVHVSGKQKKVKEWGAEVY